MTEKIDIVTSVKTAFEYGPFYFALLLLLTVSTLAGRTYRNVCKRPESTPAERETHRKYFVASYALGLVLVGVSVVWWVAFRPKLYSYSVVIRNLHDYESVASERTVYFQPEATNLIDEEGAQTRNERVLAIQDRPFKSGQRIRLDYAKDRRPRGTYEIEWVDDEKEPEFELTYNPSTERNELTKVTRHAGLLDVVIRTAHAQQIDRARTGSATAERAQPAGARAKVPSSLRAECKSMSIVLDPRSSVGTRIVTLEEFLSVPDAVARQCVLDRNAAPEAISTLYDLTSHSDRELAARARSLLEKVHWEEALAADLSSAEDTRRRGAEAIVARLRPADARRILQKAGSSVEARSATLITKAESRNAAGVPIATGTSGGDRYYVRATWDPTNAQLTECLTKLFNRELISSRTLDEERELMRNRSSRTVYSVGSDWAEHISNEISGCGAKPAYVSY